MAVQKLRIVFMGTPGFAVAGLERLLNSPCAEVVGVVTAPDKPAGRGLKLQPSAVKAFALAQGLPVLQPEKLRDPDFLAALAALQPDLNVVVAFRMLPEVVFALPHLGSLNLHASLLPNYRGAAPINWAIINGETETGVTTFRLQHEIDTGNMLEQARISIPDTWNAGQLHDALMQLGADVLDRTVCRLAAGDFHATPQITTGAEKPAPKLTTETGRIDWHKPAVQVNNLIRGLSPFPCAFTTTDGLLLKIYEARVGGLEDTLAAPGAFCFGKGRWWVACADGWLELLDVQLEGRKRMAVKDLLNGYRPIVQQAG